MMTDLLDFQGCLISTRKELSASQSTVLLNSVNDYMHNVFAYYQDWHVILNALTPEVDPQNILANVFAADYYIAKADITKALEHLALAAASQTQAQHEAKEHDILHTQSSSSSSTTTSIPAYLFQPTPRESWYLQAFQAWLSGQPQLAYEIFTKISINYPKDLFAVKRGQLIAFILGDTKGSLSLSLYVCMYVYVSVCVSLSPDLHIFLFFFIMYIDYLILFFCMCICIYFVGMLSIITEPVVVKTCEAQQKRYYHGMLSFALEQNGKYLNAEITAKKSSSHDLSDPWADHGVAHSLLSQGTPNTPNNPNNPHDPNIIR